MSQQPSDRSGRSSLPTVAKVLLFAVLPILLAVVLVIVVLNAVLRPATSTNQQFDLDAGAGVAVDVGNATLDFAPSADDRVHVKVSGFSWGSDAPVTATDSGSITEISGGCRGGWFSFCRMSLEVALPADLPLEVRGVNGRIAVNNLTGDLVIQTSNGAVEVRNSVGTVDVRTSNGSITLEDSSSTDVETATTNGQVELDFSSAPRTVEASSTNGAISILVPDDGTAYRIDADTVNGRVETGSVPTESDSVRSISARTTNGAVTIEVDD